MRRWTDPPITRRIQQIRFEAPGQHNPRQKNIRAFGPDLRDKKTNDHKHPKEDQHLTRPAIPVLLGKESRKILVQVGKISPGQITAGYDHQYRHDADPLRILHAANIRRAPGKFFHHHRISVQDHLRRVLTYTSWSCVLATKASRSTKAP